jgi:hypothetical protein
MSDRPPFSKQNVTTLGDITAHVPRDAGQFLRFYHQHREVNPLPWDWSEDLSGITDYAHCVHKAYPELVFSKETWRGTFEIVVDLFVHDIARVIITDPTGEGLNQEELVDLIDLLLGVHTTAIETETEEEREPEADPVDTSGDSNIDLDPEVETWLVTENDSIWVLDFDVQPYLSLNGLCTLYVREEE